MLDVIDADTAPSSFDPIVSVISLTAITKADHRPQARISAQGLSRGSHHGSDRNSSG
jgi:hypothetical protein